jgi:hypothetical protein
VPWVDGRVDFFLEVDREDCDGLKGKLVGGQPATRTVISES